MNLEEVEVIVKPDGQVEIRVRGVKGEACLALTRPLEELLGGEILLRLMTSEAAEEDTSLDAGISAATP